jgi:hypothetical protein
LAKLSKPGCGVRRGISDGRVSGRSSVRMSSEAAWSPRPQLNAACARPNFGCTLRPLRLLPNLDPRSGIVCVAMAELQIPNRYESLEAIFGQEIRPLIVPIDADLQELNALRDRARTQNGGLLCFLLGATGVGKTTSIHAAAIHMPDEFAPVLKVPLEIALRDTVPWLASSLPPPAVDKTRIVLFDGREITDDDVGLRQLLSSLNQLLRRRSDVLFCWPTTDKNWWAHIRDLAQNIGGDNFSPSEASVEIAGPPAGEWPLVLERLLLQFGKTFDDVGIASDLVGQMCSEQSTIGDFLGRVSALVAERLTKMRVAKRLPPARVCRNV